MAWTDDRIDRLKTLFADGLSGSQMAADLGVTRNAVIGKLHRLGMGESKTYGTRRTPKPSTPKLPRTYGTRKAPFVFPTPELAPETPEMDSEIVDNIIPVGQRKTLLELTEDSCRWPIGDPGSKDFFFCGGPAVTSLPYCAYHSRVAYQPAPARRARPYHGSENRGRAA